MSEEIRNAIQIADRINAARAAEPKKELPPAIDAAYVYVDEQVSRCDGRHGPAPYWYGWALREAFLAGVEWQKQKEAERA